MEANLELENDLIYLDSSVIESTNKHGNNPFYLPTNGSLLKYTKNMLLSEEYHQLYILCLSDNFKGTEDNNKKIDQFYHQNSSISELELLANLVTLVRGPFYLINYPSIRSGLLIVDRLFLEHFNHNNYLLAEKEMVYLMLETRESSVIKWIRIHEPKNIFDKFIKQKIFINYYQLNCERVTESLITMLENIPDFKYWQYEENCNISIDSIFNKREFNIMMFKKFHLTDEANNNEHNKILETIYNDKKNCNNEYPDQIMNPNMEETKKIKYIPTKTDELRIKMKDVEELLTSSTMSEKEKYFLICNILLSKDYCHYVIGNKKILENNSKLFIKYLPIFRYVMSYAWISLYLEEHVKGKKIKKDDRFVFDINTASMLPVFPFDINYPYQNPYFSLLVSEKSLDVKNNINSIHQPYNYQNGIVDLNEFRRRLNIFMTGNPNLNLLDGANWSNMVITGSTMAAIIPKTNPLFAFFNSSRKNTSVTEPINDTELENFFQEYYGNSDIDIACNHSNICDFIDNAKHLVSIISKNFGPQVEKQEIILIPNKTLSIYIDSGILKKKYQNKEIPFDYDYLSANKEKYHVKLYFYDLYLEQKKISNTETRKKLGDKISEDKYFEITKYCDFDKTSLIIIDKIPATNISNVESVFIIKDNDNVFIKFSETLKYRIVSKHMKRQIELFRTNCEEFFSCIGKFHLPCVRSYYDGSNCYMLPSAITSYQTLTNIDFNYFVGTKDPISIIDKYRMRGYGTLLNKDEISKYILYILHTQKKTVYSCDGNNDAKKIVGVLDTNHNLFKPAHIKGEKVNSTLSVSIYQWYSARYPQYPKKLLTYAAIKKNGNVDPPKKHLIGISYDLLSKKMN
jgi:tRNA isopentenyl-2-thiomethyl-A-37 hydroxylase MiaE